MVTQPRGTASTRDRLLIAACRIFAAKGYRDTTVADICEAAQANIASVNYHFGNKESLYRQVWTRLIDLYEPPEAPAVAPGPEVAERTLKAHIIDRLEWLVQGDPLERLLRAELVQPTGLVDDLRGVGLTKTQEHFKDAVSAVSADSLSEATVQLCVTSILSQCRALMALSKLGHYQSSSPMPSDAEIETFANHVTIFSLAGIKALMEREEALAPAFTVDTKAPPEAAARPRHA